MGEIEKMSVLMVGVDKSTKGGMWTVVENYLQDKDFVNRNDLVYVPTSITGCSILKRLLFTASAFLKIKKVFKNKKITITHVHMSERASIIRKRIVMDYAKKHGAKVVLHMHGAEFEVLYKQMNESRQKFVKETLDIADKIVILGEYWRDFIGELINDESKICVVYNAVKVPEKYEYDINSNVILFLGAVSKRKGINILLDALKQVEQDIQKKVNVKIYGPDVEKNIIDCINTAGLQNWVEYCGWLGKDEKKSVLMKTAINVLPSYNEGLPMTILEAMSYGVPTISTAIAAIPEVINDKNGVLVSPGNVEELENAIESLLSNNDLREFLSRNAYEDAKTKFSIDKHIKNIQNIYMEISQ